MNIEVPEVQLPSLTKFPEEVFTATLEGLLPAHVQSRRWFRAKTRSIERIAIADVLDVPETHAHLLVLKIEYTDGEPDRYMLPLSIARDDSTDYEEVLARLHSHEGEKGVLYSALGDRQFRNALLHAIACESRIGGRRGELVASRTQALADECDAASLAALESFVSRAEQSNTSIIYRGRFILKLFRKLEPGINPDLEIGKFLTDRGFRNTPAVLGTLEYRSQADEDVYAAGILQQFVPNQGDAWQYTLDSLASFFKKALVQNGKPISFPAHPLEGMNVEIPAEFCSLAGSYLESAALLGRRTAQMHAALTDPQGGSDFTPEQFTARDRQIVYEELVGQAEIAFGLLRRKQAGLTGAAGENARELLQREREVTQRFSALRDSPVRAIRIRHHGDYHLGQVLFTGTDFMIIDFEGEPARPLAERRVKALALRDVAGMIRSFQYAAYAALFGQVPGVPTGAEVIGKVEAWADAWNAVVSAAYLKAYFEEAKGFPFVPESIEEWRILLDAFLLQKALYEVAYELNNRPDWVQIPLRGILSLVS